MTELYEKSQSKLELGQVLEMLSQCAGSEGGKAACLALVPDSDLDTVRELLDQTTAASDLCARKGNPTFADVGGCVRQRWSGQTGAAACSPWSCCGSQGCCAAPGPSRAMWRRTIPKPRC